MPADQYLFDCCSQSFVRLRIMQSILLVAMNLAPVAQPIMH